MDPISFNEDGSIAGGASSGVSSGGMASNGFGAASVASNRMASAVPQLSVEKELAFDVHEDVMDYEAGYMSASGTAQG